MNDAVQKLTSIWRAGGRIVLLGVGSPLRADDSVGLYIVESLQSVLPKEEGRETHFFLGESAPENFSGAIREVAPTHVVIFDAAQFEKEPGAMMVIAKEEIAGVSFSTHILPLKILVDYLVEATGCEVTVIGMQPKLLEFAYPMTNAVKAAADRFVKEVQEAMAYYF
jgi:hydrogenase 3 maturation protease